MQSVWPRATSGDLSVARNHFIDNLKAALDIERALPQRSHAQ
jgi:hypothetical protein